MNESDNSNDIGQLLDRYESGSLSRRDLLRGLAAVGVASLLTEALVPRADDGVAAATHINDPGRHDLLARIINQEFEKASGGADNEVTLKHVFPFDSSKHHQAWLFGFPFDEGSGPPNTDWENHGLAQYSNGKRTALTRQAPNTGHGSQKDIATSNGPEKLWEAVERADAIEVLCLGSAATGPDYKFQDLYGLVKLKINHACEHVLQDTLYDTVMHIKTQLKKIADDSSDADQTKAADALDVLKRRVIGSTDWNGEFRTRLQGVQGKDGYLKFTDEKWNEIVSTFKAAGAVGYPGDHLNTHGSY